MSLMLGDLTIEQIESRAGVKFPDPLKEFMYDRHNPSASKIQPGKWHCFDMPFMIVCGDEDTATKILEYLLPLSSEFKEALLMGLA